MNIKPLKTELDHAEALKRIEVLWDAKKDTEKGDELEILATLVCAFEEKQYHIDTPNPVEAIKFRMEQENLEPADLVQYMGQRSRVTEVLNYQRKLSLNMIRKLSTGLKIPLDCLVKEYNLVK